MPEHAIPNLLCYENLIAPHDAAFDWPMLDERAAASLCYMSGTTGNPKGALYSHRSTLLHASRACMTDGMGMAARDMLFMASPMFHVNAWGMPYACAMSGASMVLPGPALDGASIYSAMKTERVTVALGVPTVWMGFQAARGGPGPAASRRPVSGARTYRRGSRTASSGGDLRHPIRRARAARLVEDGDVAAGNPAQPSAQAPRLDAGGGRGIAGQARPRALWRADQAYRRRRQCASSRRSSRGAPVGARALDRIRLLPRRRQ